MEIKHRLGSYPVGYLSHADLFKHLDENWFFVTDSNVTHLVSLPPNSKAFVIEAGETSKNSENYLKLLNWLVESGANRSSGLVAVGGGVVGDLTGFVASTYMRGIDFVMVPTSLLAMVDSSVGGKVGIDLPAGKNLVGAFWPPTEVRICLDLIDTLPNRHLINGFAEVLKYGFIAIPEIFKLTDEFFGAACHDRRVLEKIIKACIQCKQKVVESDERELNGNRAILNFGHTVGHAIEAELGYSDLLHGEAISIGMAVEALISEMTNFAPPGTFEFVIETLRKAGLPLRHPVLQNPEKLILWMSKDKKSENGALAFSLLTGIGSCKLERSVPYNLVLNSLNQVRSI